MQYLENQHVESRPKRERRIDWMSVIFFSIVVLSFTLMYQYLSLLQEVKMVKKDIAYIQECMSNLHNVMWHRDDQTIVAAVDCPSVKTKD